MDVALDANVILNDPRMQGNAFHSLLAYLRKTDSRLVLSKVVFDEAIARYPERLRAAAHKAAGPVGVLRNLVFDAKIKMSEIDFSREARKLKQKLRKPSQHIRPSLVLRNFAYIRLDEIAKRGIERIPPANGAGEELRDVIHWLMILAHAETSKREIAFISADEHFRKDQDLHPRLSQDLQEHKAHLHFYISIEDFIKAHAPAPRELTESEAFEYYSKVFVADRFEIEARKFFPRRWPAASSIEIHGREVSLIHGALYDVAAHSQFGELEFQGQLKIHVDEHMILNSGVSSYGVPIGGTFSEVGYASAGVTPFYPQLGSAFAGVDIDKPPELTPTVAHWLAKTNPIITYLPTTSASDYELSGKLVISIRIINGKVTNIETERFELSNIASASS